MNSKKRMVLTIAFVISLIPMLLSQYGGGRGVQEISGLLNLSNPIGIVAIGLFVLGVWGKFSVKVARAMGAIGVIGIVAAEVYTYLTWHVMTITGEVSLENSMALAYPEFYFGVAVSVLMVIVYLVVSSDVRQ
ncbi:MAG: hypothetical protein PUD55_05960 [Firmicutes bacterium]|nr:hypothetical protein [Bacillota bacterium]